jgi:hypothetical protein
MKKKRRQPRQPKQPKSIVDLDLLIRLPEILERMAICEKQVVALKAELLRRSSVSDLVSVDEAVRLSGKSREALYKLIQRGVLPSVKRSRSIFVRRRDVTRERT